MGIATDEPWAIAFLIAGAIALISVVVLMLK
jgi:hypothetical protein